MTRKDLFKMLFSEVELNTDGCGTIMCNNVNGCNGCIFENYWDKPPVISKATAKNILNSAYGVFPYFDSDKTYMVYTARNNGKTYAQHLALIHDGWIKLPSLHNNIDWTTLNEIMCDAIVNGFEVKILDGTIYYREKQ